MFTIDLQQQREMEEAFFEQLHARCQPADNEELSFPPKVGIETEYLLVDNQGKLIPEAVRNRILEHVPHSSAELGMSTIETHTAPVLMSDSNHSMLQEMRAIEREAVDAASSQGCRLVRIGSYPGSFADLDITQQPDRYQWLMDLSHKLHGVDDDSRPLVQLGNITLPRRRCDVMSGCQSIHMNIQLPAGETAIWRLNKMLELVPYLVALAAHSSLMNCSPTGMREFRIPLWEPLFNFPRVDAEYGVNTRRTGFPDYYYRNWDDYWRDVGRKLYFATDTRQAFDSNMKQFWRAVRLKPCPGRRQDCLLEIRTFSTQPTLEEDAALYLVVGALLHEPDWMARPLLPLEYARVNLDQASKYGMEADLYTFDETRKIVLRPAVEIVGDLLERAIRLWRGVSPEHADLIGLLQRRLQPEGATPALESVRRFEQAQQAGASSHEAAQQVLLSYVVEP